ncbi:MAG: hypothetical protein AAB972_02035, partial [Patescibacteria group bacterium]
TKEDKEKEKILFPASCETDMKEHSPFLGPLLIRKTQNISFETEHVFYTIMIDIFLVRIGMVILFRKKSTVKENCG